MPTVEQSGTLNADGTEQTLASITSNRSIVVVIDPTAMAAGDRVVIRAKRKVLATSSLKTFQSRDLAGAQSGLVVMDPVPSPIEAAITIEQTGGTFRAFPYSVEAL